MKDLTNPEIFNSATKQEIFDFSASHLLKQGAKSLERKGVCRYRSPSGLKCAAGVFIADSRYRETMEGRSWTAIKKGLSMPAHSELVNKLQEVHDHIDVIHWPERLVALAEEFGLSSEVVATAAR
jgi:hypothetical protein